MSEASLINALLNCAAQDLKFLFLMRFHFLILLPQNLSSQLIPKK
jgi:hypothetical protein